MSTTNLHIVLHDSMIRYPFILATLAVGVTMCRSLITMQSRHWPRTTNSDGIRRSTGLRRRSVRWTTTPPPSNVGDDTTTTIIASNHDDQTKSAQHYVFGYGSLMCPLSRQITNENLMNKFTIPILIQDLERRWCARTTTGYTAMGVQFTRKRFCTGILIGTIDSVELEDLDRREASYHRLPVPLETIGVVPFVNASLYGSIEPSSRFEDENDYEHRFIKNILKSNSYRGIMNQTIEQTTNNVRCDPTVDYGHIHVWVYVPKNPIPPDASHPILQSYVDIIIRGCFRTIGEPLARSFISTTAGWFPSNHNNNNNNNSNRHHIRYWVNDRDRPVYKRADRIYSVLNAAKIDHVIFDEVQAMTNISQNSNDDRSSLQNETLVEYRRNIYDPLFHLEQLTHRLEEDSDSVHPMAFQHWASQFQTVRASK